MATKPPRVVAALPTPATRPKSRTLRSAGGQARVCQGALMWLSFLRFGVVLVVLSLPLAGCLETVGRTPYNRAPTAKPTCNHFTPDGDIVGYSCPNK
jgi:hypothetical protein